jgi:hypothetical protein
MMRLFLHMILWLACMLPVFANPPGISLRWGTAADTVLIGAPLPARVEAVLPDSLPPDWTLALGNLSPFELWESDTLPVQVLPGGNYKHTLQLIIASFEEGEHRVGPLVLALGTDTLYSNLITLAVTIIPVDTTGDIRPIMPPMTAPLTWQEWLWRILAGLAILALLIAALLWFIKWRKRKNDQTPPILDKPVREWALQELSLLEQQLPATEPATIKHYYDRLSYIIRVFIHYQYGIPALELTSKEIGKWAADITGYAAWEPVIMPVINEADLAKFAKATPGEDHQRHAYTAIRQWIATSSAPKPPAS